MDWKQLLFREEHIPVGEISRTNFEFIAFSAPPAPRRGKNNHPEGSPGGRNSSLSGYYRPPSLNQMGQPDSIISDLYNPLDYNRYSYVRYNPLKYTDPSGHCVTSGGNINASQAPYGDSGPCDYWNQVAPVTGETFPTEYLPDEYWTEYDTDTIEHIIDWIAPEKGTFSLGFSGTGGAGVYLSGSMDIFAIDQHGNVAMLTPSVGGGDCIPIFDELIDESDDMPPFQVTEFPNPPLIAEEVPQLAVLAPKAAQIGPHPLGTPVALQAALVAGQRPDQPVGQSLRVLPWIEGLEFGHFPQA